MSELLPADPEQFAQWMKNFAATVPSFMGRFGLDPFKRQQIASIAASIETARAQVQGAERLVQTASDAVRAAELDFAAAQQQCKDAEQAQDAAIAAQERAFLDVAEQLRPLVERMQSAAKTSISSSKNERPGSGATPLQLSGTSHTVGLPAPTELTARSQPGRIVVLTWKNGGHGPGTSYILEAAIGTLYRGSPQPPAANAYQVVATVIDEVAYAHSVGRVPSGVMVKYRLRAKKDAAQSPYSNEVLVTSK